MKELIWSLAWYPFSAHHSKNVENILKGEYPDEDMSKDLAEFEKAYLSKPGPGSPK